MDGGEAEERAHAVPGRPPQPRVEANLEELGTALELVRQHEMGAMPDRDVGRRPDRGDRRERRGPAQTLRPAARPEPRQPREHQRRHHRHLLAEQGGEQRRQRGPEPPRRGLVERDRGEEPQPHVHEMARPRDQRARGFGEQRKGRDHRRRGPRPPAMERAVEEQRGERQEHHVERGDQPRMGEDEPPQRLVIELVGDRAPESRRAAAVEQGVGAREEHAVEEVEVLSHRLAERCTPGVDDERQHREDAGPRPAVALERYRGLERDRGPERG